LAPLELLCQPAGVASKRQPIDELIDALAWMRRNEARKNALPSHLHMKRPTNQERLLKEQMLALLEWAADHSKRWHDIGTLRESQKAAELLAQRGVIEIRQPMNQYRLKPAPK
jgi:hypothetical protein